MIVLTNVQAQTVVNYLVVEDKTPPFQIVDNGESRGGIVSDMIAAIFTDSDYTVKSVVYPVNRLRQVVAQDRVENWIAYDAPEWGTFGNKGLFVEEPLLQTHHVLLTCRQDLPERIESLEDIRGMRLLTLRHFDYEALDQAAENGVIRQVPIDRYEAGIQLVSMGRADGFVEMESRLRFHVHNHRRAAGDCLRWLDFSPVIPDFSIYLAIDVDWPPSFREFVRQRLQELRMTGELDRIVARYRVTGSDNGLNASGGVQ